MLQSLKPRSIAPAGGGGLLKILGGSHRQSEEVEEWSVFPWELRDAWDYSPKVYMLMAPRGRGKTVAQTAMARFMLDSYQYRKQNVAVISNYMVKFATMCDPYLLDKLIEFPQWGRKKLVLIDEVTEFVPSSRAMSNASRDVASFIRQIRKRGVDIITNTQFPIEVDRRLLRQVDLFIEVDMQWRRRKESEKGASWKADVDLYIYDYWGYYNRANWGKQRKWPPDRGEADKVTTLENVHKIFNQFNTEEIQVSMWAPDREGILEAEGWGFNDDGTEDSSPPEPMPGTAQPGRDAFDTFLAERQRSDGSLNVNMLYEAARAWPEGKGWKAPADFQAWLTQHGWELEADDALGGPNRVLAFRA